MHTQTKVKVKESIRKLVKYPDLEPGDWFFWDSRDTDIVKVKVQNGYIQFESKCHN